MKNLLSTTELKSNNLNKLLEFFVPKNGMMKAKILTTSETTEMELDLKEISLG
jgi:hypothetical protein